MIIEWVGHACFKIRLKDGTNLLFDPFDDKIGYKQVDTTADYVFISHDHYDHSCLKHIVGAHKIVRTPGEFDFENIKVKGIKQFHDDEKGKKHGEIVVYSVKAEGITLVHMGDIGHLPDKDFYEQLGKVDILMIPVGGVSTVNADQALEICKAIEPNIILPMHYKTLFLEMSIDPVYKFTDAAGRYFDRSRLGSSSFEITADNLKKRSRIIIMEHSVQYQ